MPIIEGKDHDELVYIEVYDITIFGAEAQDRLAQTLNDLHESSLAKLEQEGHLAKFTRAFNELIQIISDFGPAVDSSLTNEIAFYSDALRKLDAAVQGDDAVLTTKLNEARNLAKRILKNFLINPKPEEPAPEISKPRLRVAAMFTKLMSGLRSHDK